MTSTQSLPQPELDHLTRVFCGLIAMLCVVGIALALLLQSCPKRQVSVFPSQFEEDGGGARGGDHNAGGPEQQQAE